MIVISVQLFTLVIISLSSARRDSEFWEGLMLSYFPSNATGRWAKLCLKHFLFASSSVT
jgi:hypothetical protein